MVVAYYRAPTFRSIAGGLFVLALLLFLLCSIGQLVRWMGSALLLIPAALGMVEQVRPGDVRAIDIRTSPSLIWIEKPGRYAVYTDSLELLEITDNLIAARAKPWLAIRNTATGQAVPVAFVERGVIIFDTPLASGRAIFAFDIPEAGSYELTHLTRRTTLTLTPDYVTGNEGKLMLIVAIELGLAAGVLGALYLPRRWKRYKEQTETQSRRRAQVEQVWQQLASGRSGETDQARAKGDRQ